MTEAADAVIKPPRYLVCVDYRQESKTALRLACMKARARNGSVTMVHVIAPEDFHTLGSVADRMKEERRQEADKLLKECTDEAHADFSITPIPVLREGTVGEELIAATEEDNEVITIVIGVATDPNKRGKLSAFLAAQLGINLQVPLLMVPGNLTDQQLQTLV